MRRTDRSVCLLACVLLLAVPATSQEGPATFEFSFSNPGARSMGLGGAFAALADDATAAFANPAGLVQLIEPEVSLEGRSWSYDIPFVAGGRASGVPTGIGNDTVGGLRYGVSSSTVSGLSYLSFVYPGDRWAVAVYRHRWANFSVTRQIDSLFGVIDGELERAEDILATTDLEVANNGIVGAYELTDGFSVGGGLVYFQARMDSRSQEFAVEDEDFFASNPRDPELLDTAYTLGGSDSGFTFHGGFSWRPNPQWSFGGYFREGPELAVEVTEIVGPANDEALEGTVELDVTTPLRLPSVYGLGAAFRMLDGALTFSFEWDRVGYSLITESLDTNVFDPGQIELSDGDELHFGTEYVFQAAQQVFALRFGAWRDPAHGLDSGPDADLFERAVFGGGADDIHFAGGVGVVFNHVQFDFGFDLSDTADLVSVSVVYRF